MRTTSLRHGDAIERGGSAAWFWRSPWLRPLNDVVAIDDLLEQVHPTWSLQRIKARVVAANPETPDTRSLVLHPNRNWPGCRPGQHVLVDAEIDGVRHQRSYSLSSATDSERTVAITVKRQPGGIVSNWLHDEVGVGDVLALGRPTGEFVLPEPLPARLLMLSAGSGITPLMSMVRHLWRRGYGGDIEFVHACRNREHAIFGAELADLAETWPAFNLRHHYSIESGRLDVPTLTRLVPDLADRCTLMCGPQAFMETFVGHWRERGMEARLRVEHFTAPIVHTLPGEDSSMSIRLARSEKVFRAQGANALLIEAERAGLKPRYGCRIGICHTCQCVKRSGIVENLLTGRVSSQPDERIQLCISRARSNLILEL
jgi:ferredoxin-NADP reductase